MRLPWWCFWWLQDSSHEAQHIACRLPRCSWQQQKSVLEADLQRIWASSDGASQLTMNFDCHCTQYAGLSYNSILGKFMVFSTDAEISRKMLSVNDASSLLMAVHPSAKNILGTHLTGLKPLFTIAVELCCVGASNCALKYHLRPVFIRLECCSYCSAGPSNLAFMHGPAHKAIRKSFLALFTRKALGTYVELQDGIVRRHIAQWLQSDSEREIRPFIR